MAEMKTYDEETHELIENPDLENGYIYPGQIQVGMTEERSEVMEGTVEVFPPNGLKRYYPPEPIYEDCYFYHKYKDREKPSPIPGSDAIYEDCYFYHKYKDREKPSPIPGSDAIYDEMAEAYRSGVNSI